MEKRLLPHGVEIRKACVEDAEGLACLLRITYNNSYPMRELMDAASVRRILNEKSDIWYVAVHGDKIVGSVAGIPHKWNRTYEGCRGATHPDYRRTGIGRRLYETLLEEFYRQEHCDLTFGFPRTFGMYVIMTRDLSNPLLLTGHDGGMHIVDSRREHHLMGINKNPHRKLTRVIPCKSRFVANGFITNDILSKIEFENVRGDYPEIFITGPDAQNYIESNGIGLGYLYISASRSMHITKLSNNHNQDIKTIIKSIQWFITKPPFPVEHIYMYVLADKENLIREMCKTGFEIASYLPAWHHEGGKRYDCLMLVKAMYKEEPVAYGTHEIIRDFKSNFVQLLKTMDRRIIN